MPALATMECLIYPRIGSLPFVGLLTPTLVPTFFAGLTKYYVCDHVLTCDPEPQPLIENLVQIFNLVGVVASRVILIYKT